MMALKSFFEKIPKRVWLYVAVSIVGFLAVFLPLAMLSVCTLMYAAFWGIFSAVMIFVIARTIYHVAVKDATAETWAESIYAVAADLGWLMGILSTTWTIAIIGIVVMIVGFTMSACTRFIGKDGIKAKKTELLEKLKDNLRYRYMGDTIDGKLDTNRYLIVVDGVKDPLTVNQAIEKGYKDAVEEAIAYINMAIDNSAEFSTLKK